MLSARNNRVFEPERLKAQHLRDQRPYLLLWYVRAFLYIRLRAIVFMVVIGIMQIKLQTECLPSIADGIFATEVVIIQDTVSIIARPYGFSVECTKNKRRTRRSRTSRSSAEGRFSYTIPIRSLSRRSHILGKFPS